MTQKTTIDDLDSISKQLTESVVADVLRIRKEISHPALSHKLTKDELWAKYGTEYQTLREDENAWKQTIDQMGEKDAIEFGRAMEQAMEAQNANQS